MLRSVGWFYTDVSRLPIGYIFKGQALEEEEEEEKEEEEEEEEWTS
jgi:hypothetical protein